MRRFGVSHRAAEPQKGPKQAAYPLCIFCAVSCGRFWPAPTASLAPACTALHAESARRISPGGSPSPPSLRCPWGSLLRSTDDASANRFSFSKLQPDRPHATRQQRARRLVDFDTHSRELTASRPITARDGPPRSAACYREAFTWTRKFCYFQCSHKLSRKWKNNTKDIKLNLKIVLSFDFLVHLCWLCRQRSNVSLWTKNPNQEFNF